jgi:hypothetical protein
LGRLYPWRRVGPGQGRECSRGGFEGQGRPTGVGTRDLFQGVERAVRDFDFFVGLTQAFERCVVSNGGG